MGRTEKSQGLAPPAIRKDIRAKQARNIINKVVPATLASNARARQGADSSELFADPGPASSNDARKIDAGGEDVAYVKRKGQGRRKAKDRNEGEDIVQDGAARKSQPKTKKSGKRRNDSIDEDISSLTLGPKAEGSTPPRKERTVKIVTTDSLTAAQMLSATAIKPAKKSPNTCILNMASPLRPGGGVLAGATSQEEFLCARTTLLPSLKESFYRLPEYGGIFTADVLVFRSPGPLGDSAAELGAGDRYYVDVISAGMLRFPDLEGEEDEPKTLARKDREVVERKMRAVLRVAQAKGVRKLVLGAWGCGAYGNPIADIAEAWARVLSGAPSGGKKGRTTTVGETWPSLEDVVFAIPNPRMAADFAQAFGGGVEVEAGPRSLDDNDEEESEEAKATQELRLKIEEMESQISKVWNADLKSRLGVVLDGLKAQLKERQDDGDSGNENGLESEEEEEELDLDGVDEEAGRSHDEPDSDDSQFEDGVELDTGSSELASGAAVRT